MRAKRKSTLSAGFQIVGHKKAAGGAEAWCVRTSDGRIKTLKTKASAVKIMDRTEKRFAGLLERLAKR